MRHDARVAQVKSLVAQVLEGPDAGHSAVGDVVTVGTAEGSALRLSDPAVSRFHVELRAAIGGISVVDHASTNGTFTGGVRIERGIVPAGTALRLGGSTVRVGDAKPAEVEMFGDDSLGGLIGRAPAMRRLMAQLAKAAASDVSVLVTGESGTGKELVARALHDLGPRRGGPFVTVDCGSLPPTLLASELFGHERGAFTGADRAHVGAFEAATGGTVFLDEIGELQPAVQATLLGVLERRRLRRLGSRTEIAVDVRVVAATHRDLRAEVNRNGFRLDLYYRLAVVTLVLPALRERPDDVPLLVEHFLRDAGWDQPVATLISPQAMDALSKLHFAGNVRELRNLVEAAVAMGEAPVVGDAAVRASSGDVAQLPVDLALPYKDARAELTTAFEERYVAALLERTGGNVSAAARAAQMTRSHLNELIAKRKR
ncbi:MAG TPA: sigma 54-interacting transcriptional regulator [Kofleriaceae bacterium]|jgi:DNA-binding NtrC family response regulator|nr:sigma 54-interacting transcriptional regulator [Kofleriaceae bacterium]